MNIFGENLKRIRAEKNITQLELSELLGIGKGYIAQIETGHRTSTLKFMNKIADALNVPLKNFFEEVTDENKF